MGTRNGLPSWKNVKLTIYTEMAGQQIGRLPDERLRIQHGIEMIAPNRRKRKRTQDGRPPRRYLRRWKIERLFAWLKNFRRLTGRWERY